jgi:hypothetical protein
MHENDASRRPSDRSIPRRRFLRDGSLLTGAALTGIVVPFSNQASAEGSGALARLLKHLNLQTPESLDAYAPVALTADELTTLKAAIGRIIPADDLGPGAVEAGVFVFIDQALAASDDALALYQAGLAALDAAAGSGGFGALDAESQDGLLMQAEAGDLADAPEGFFATLIRHTRSGMFSDPIHGGNKDFIGWDLIQFPGIKLVWTEADQQIDAVVKPEHISVATYRGEQA